MVVLLVACGGKSAGPSAPVVDPEVTADAAGAPKFDLSIVPTTEELCTRARELAAEGCRPFSEWPIAMLDNCLVDGGYVSGAQACYLEKTCDRFDECVDYVIETGAPYRGPTSECRGGRPTLPAGVADLEDSYGRTAKKLSDAPSTKFHPIEVCGIPEEATYLTRVTCDDGSKPFASLRAARASRVGNVGIGGRCGRIIDRFVVSCPEKEYEVFIDAYRCVAKSGG